jgi:RNA polymerase sigma factor (sigma-70 family)
VQEATLMAYLSLTRLRCPARFGSWLCGISLNLARRCLRDRRWLVLMNPTDVEGASYVEVGYEAAEIAALVREAVSRLAPGQRDATLLFYWQGLTHLEVAAELDISVGAVKSRLHQARAALARPLATVFDDQEVLTAMSTPAIAEWIEVSVADIRRGESDDPGLQPHVVLLQERHGDRVLPVWIGRAEATALALSLETAEMPRPMTYQFMANLLTATKARVREVRITRLVETTFYAVLILEGPEGRTEVDARPSDALNLALVTGAAMLVSGELLDDAGVAGRTEWHAYPTTAARLVFEVRQQHNDMAARFERK